MNDRENDLVTDPATVALIKVIRDTLVALRASVADIGDHPQTAVKRILEDASTLSSCLSRLDKRSDYLPQQTAECDPASAGTDYRDLLRVVERLRTARRNGPCVVCGHILPDV